MKSKYKNWSYRFFIYLVIINIVIVFLTINFVSYSGNQKANGFVLKIMILSILSFIFFIAGSILTILSYTKKENKDYKFYISAIGYPLFLILSILAKFMN